MWTGPLHERQFILRMQALAAEWGWTGHAFDATGSGVKMTGHNCPRPLEKQLALMLSESEPALPPWFLPMGHIARWLGVSAMPPRDALIEALAHDGHAASRSHVEVRSRAAS
jgi:tRNA G26 N,N-dimethylase Trm1